MKAARAFDHDDVRVVELPRPVIGPGDALVRVRVCGICSGDVLPWYIRRKCPTVIGHEPAGEIVEVGAGVEGWKPGDRVFIHHHAPCLECRACQRGLPSMCAAWRASSLDPGGMAEFCRVPALNLAHDTLHLPDELSFDDGALIEPLACVVRAFHRSGIQPGDTLAVVGLGFIGQAMVALGRHYGAARIVASDVQPWRLQRARELGADKVFDAREVGAAEAVDVVMVCASKPEAIQAGIDQAAPGGRILMFMPPEPGTPLALDPNQLFFRELSLLTSYSCGPAETRETLELLRSGVVRSEWLITHRFPLSEAQAACRLTAAAGESLKVVVDL